MGNEHNWGYSPTHHFALKANYGTKNDLKQLVDECHSRGIRVIFDGVFNHSSSECPLVLIDKNYWVKFSKFIIKKKLYLFSIIKINIIQMILIIGDLNLIMNIMMKH